MLEGLLRWRDPLRMTEQMTGDGAALLADACREGWEGLIAKRLGTPYVSTRSRDWLKLKCTRAQELVIGGFTAPRGSRTDLGALLVGHFEGDRLRYAGKVGTGFTRATLRELAERLAPLVRETSPVRAREGHPARGDLGRARARRADRVHGVDGRRPPAPPVVPRACASTSPRARSCARACARDSAAALGGLRGAANDCGRLGRTGAPPTRCTAPLWTS